MEWTRWSPQVPQVDNTNVDRSLAIMHRTVFTYMRHLAHAGLPAAVTPREALDQLYRRIDAIAGGSKAMLRLIQQKVRMICQSDRARVWGWGERRHGKGPPTRCASA